MRIVIQRVQHASVTIDGSVYSSIGAGLLVLVGVENGDVAPMPNGLQQRPRRCAYLTMRPA